MKIRCVTPTDFDQWKPLSQGYNHFYERTLPLEVTETTWSRFFDSSEPVHAMVAEKEGQLVGLVHYLFHRSTSMIEQSCYLQDLFTAESARGQGIGRALIEAVYEKAKSAGSSRVYWLTHETNVIAQNLYNQVAENSGFIVYRKQM
jgi:GNAT superfamily N-acetyltransferase